jgi:hypothetical protein
MRIPVTFAATVLYFQSHIVVDETHTSQGQRFQVCLATAVYLYWLGLCQHLQPLPSIGPVVVVVIKSIADIIVYIIVLVVLGLATANGMYVLIGPSSDLTVNSEQTFMNTILSVFNLLVLGEAGGITDTMENNSYETSMSLLFIVSSIVGCIVVINLIIAKLTNTFEETRKVSEQTRRKQHAALILIFEETDQWAEQGNWLKVISAFIASFPYYSFARIGRWIKRRWTSCSVGAPDSPDAEVTNLANTWLEKETANAWLHVLVEQGGNTVMWKQPRDRVLENFNTLKHHLIGGKNSRIKQDVSILLQNQVESKLDDLVRQLDDSSEIKSRLLEIVDTQKEIVAKQSQFKTGR